jgi:hypothetical protein
MDSTGALSTCRGMQCELGNPTGNAPVLPYGSVTGTGPYLCVSAKEGITCTLRSVGGFMISRAGVQSLVG